MPELPSRIDGEIIEAEHVNAATIRSIQRYTNAAQRDSLNPIPETGQPAWIIDVAQLHVWDGSAWITDYTAAYLALTGGVMSGPINMSNQWITNLGNENYAATGPHIVTLDQSVNINKEIASIVCSPDRGRWLVNACGYIEAAVSTSVVSWTVELRSPATGTIVETVMRHSGNTGDVRIPWSLTAMIDVSASTAEQLTLAAQRDNVTGVQVANQTMLNAVMVKDD